MNIPENLKKSVLMYSGDRAAIMERWLAAWSTLGYRAPVDFVLRDDWTGRAEMVVRRDNCGAILRAPWGRLESAEYLSVACEDLERRLVEVAAPVGGAA